MVDRFYMKILLPRQPGLAAGCGRRVRNPSGTMFSIQPGFPRCSYRQDPTACRPQRQGGEHCRQFSWEVVTWRAAENRNSSRVAPSPSMQENGVKARKIEENCCSTRMSPGLATKQGAVFFWY